MDELFSVIIPTYNSCETLNRAIESVQLQTYSNWEIIVVDDGSTDGTRDFLETRRQTIKYICQDNLGAGPARNAGVKISKGEYIAFLDADDEWLPEKLQLQLNIAKKVKDFGIISTGTFIIEDNTIKKFGCDKSADLKTYNFYDHFRKYHCLTSTVIISKKAFMSVGGFDPRWWSGQDEDLWMKVAYYYPVYHLPIPLVNRYIIPRSLFLGNLLTNRVNRLLMHEQWWPNLSNSLDVNHKIDKEKYMEIFETIFKISFELFLEMREFKLARFAWYRYRRILKNHWIFFSKYFQRIIFKPINNKKCHNEDISLLLAKLSEGTPNFSKNQSNRHSR